jgi:hypothetical protein
MIVKGKNIRWTSYIILIFFLVLEFKEKNPNPKKMETLLFFNTICNPTTIGLS